MTQDSLTSPYITLSFIFVLYFWCTSALTSSTRSVKEDRFECLYTHPLNNNTCKEYFFVTSVHGLNWTQAREYCQSQSLLLGYDMDLVAIETQKENDVIKEFIKENFQSHVGVLRFWMGGYDYAKDKDFMWMPTGNIATFYDWINFEPSETLPAQDVLAVCRLTDGLIGWYDDDQQNNLGHFPLCERVGVL